MILVTGGLGYIGSHIITVLPTGSKIVIADNLVNSRLEVYTHLQQITSHDLTLVQIDLADAGAVKKLFARYPITEIIHLAGLKSVADSVQNPLAYYQNNLLSTMNLLQYTAQIRRFIFSSSATVYGDAESPLTEDSSVGVGILNPYGRTKYFIEEMIKDVANVNETTFIILRYFNPVGSHTSGLLKETPSGVPANLMPYLVGVADRKYERLTIFGDDYQTADATPERDYIHVLDLAQAHVQALTAQLDRKVNIYNLGTSIPTSVLKLVHTFEEVNDVIIPVKMGPRRPGDAERVFCSATKAEKELDWKAVRSLAEMCRDAYQ